MLLDPRKVLESDSEVIGQVARCDVSLRVSTHDEPCERRSGARERNLMRWSESRLPPSPDVVADLRQNPVRD